MTTKAQLAFFLLLFLTGGLTAARDVPVTDATIKKSADALVVGQVLRTHKAGSRLSIEMRVLNKIFDRRDDIANVIIVNLHQEEASDIFKVREKYLFAVGTCDNGAHVLLGKRFAAKVVGQHVDTSNWIGFEEETKLSRLQLDFAELKARDRFLISTVCSAIFDRLPNRDATTEYST